MIAWLLDTLLYTGVLIALVLLVRRPVGHHFGPQTAYALWTLPFLRLLLPPIELPASLAPKADNMVTASQAVPPGATVPFDSVLPSAPVALAAQATTAAPRLDWPLVALALWLGGALAFMAWRVGTYRAMRRALLADARGVGESGGVRMVECPAVASPVAFGVRDKVIALPLLFMAQPDRAGRDLAIAHELEHHRGRDLAANFAAQALLALHWFNPIAWLGWRAMRRDQEAACDARVLAGRERVERVRYAALIAEAAGGPRALSHGGALAAPMACPVLGDASIIHRLRSLTRSDLSPARRRNGRLLVTGAALALPLTASFSYASAQESPAPPAPPMPLADRALPVAPETPLPPPRPRMERRFALRDDAPATPAHREIRRYIMRDGATGAEHRVEFDSDALAIDPDYQRRMDEWSKQMKKWGERYGRQMQKWGERQGGQVRRFSLVHPFPLPAPPHPLAAVPQPPVPPQPPAAPRAHEGPYGLAAPAAPIPPAAEVIESCDGERGVSTSIVAGRPRVVFCNRMVRSHALSGLRSARDRVANDSRLNEEVRRDVLQDLDQEIDRAQRDHAED